MDRKIQPQIISAIKKITQKGDFILGEEVEKFEKEFARYCGVKHCVGVASGTDAILLALRALGIGSGDEVIVPANTFISSVLPIIYVGATPIITDIDPKSYNIDVSKIEEKISKKTKAIIPVHLFGQIAEMDKILKIAKKHKLFVVEDAAQAHGSTFKNKKASLPAGKAGSFSDIACFSFYPGKNLGAYGDAGAIVTNNKSIAERIKILRNIGQVKKYIHSEKGYNSRLDTIQAAVLRIKLRQLDKWNQERRHLAALYSKLLSGLPVSIPIQTDGNVSNFHLYVIRAPKRDRLLKYLHKNKIFAGIHYPVPIHLHKALRNLPYKKGDFPVTEKYASQIISLPIFPGMSEKEVGIITEAIKNFYGYKK
ncbi:MAG: pyridoxal phosphate-dependent protein [Microgenomates group bacterium GW2011_GWA2_37_6]|nr:MAG: pyridoxal phosphate-dependent protein [Microgenomates group bacterium GW2011_GWA2_37_6]